MNNKRKLLLLLIAVLTIALISTACTKKDPTNLEEYIKVYQSEQDAIQGIASNDPNATITVTENTMELIYTVEDASISGEDLEKALDGLDDTFKEVISNLEEETGLQGIKVQVVYKNAAGNEIASKLFQ